MARTNRENQLSRENRAERDELPATRRSVTTGSRRRGRGPYEEQARGGRDTLHPTAGGWDANAAKRHLMDIARRLQIRGRSMMTKDELVQAIQRSS